MNILRMCGLMGLMCVLCFPVGTCVADDTRTEQELFSDVCARALPVEERNAAYRDWIMQQKNTVTCGELLDWFKGIRESIFSGTYECSHVGDNEPTRLRRLHTAFAGDMLYLSEEFEDGETITRSLVKAFNGSEIRMYDKLANSGAIFAFKGRDEFVNLDDLLALVMLRDMIRDTGYNFMFTDIVACLDGFAYLSERPELVDGTSCLVIYVGTPPIMKLYLDPQKDFAFVRRDHYINLYSDDAQANASTPVRGRYMNARTTAYNLTHMGGHLWLPKALKQEWFLPDGTKSGGKYIEVQSCKINTVLPDVFNQVIPSGAPVHDTVRNVTYRDVSTPEELEDVLDASLFTLRGKN